MLSAVSQHTSAHLLQSVLSALSCFSSCLQRKRGLIREILLDVGLVSEIQLKVIQFVLYAMLY